MRLARMTTQPGFRLSRRKTQSGTKYAGKMSVFNWCLAFTDGKFTAKASADELISGYLVLIQKMVLFAVLFIGDDCVNVDVFNTSENMVFNERIGLFELFDKLFGFLSL